MKIVFLSHYFYPHIGGVERHVFELSKVLIKKGHRVTIITEKFDQKLKNNEKINNIKIVRFSYPKKKLIGILFVWYFLWKKRALIKESDILHIHDVFIWYLPFRFIFPNTKVVTTIHGLEWGNPLSISGIFQKRLAVKLSAKSIGIGKFLEKYLNIKFDLVSYGAVTVPKSNLSKLKNSVVFIGRLSKDTGVLQFLKWLKGKKYKVDFIGDGELKNKCSKYGIVHGFTDPTDFIKRAEICVPGGYLACLECFANKCNVKVFWSDNLKRDYWQMSPMYEFIEKAGINNAYQWVKTCTWENLANENLTLYNSI